MTALYIAASTSSAIMPKPRGKLSRLIPRGLNISKNLNSARETMIIHQGATSGPPHRGSIEISWPTVSSTHAATGSLPQYFSDIELAQVPAMVKNAMARAVMIQAGVPGSHI